MRKRHHLMALGGTFDHFHKGHEYLIKTAFSFAEELIIGITDEKLSLSKICPETIDNFNTRSQSVKKFCKANKIPCQIIELNDIYGPTLNNELKINALTVSEETLSGAQKINQTRLALGLNKLPVYVADLVRASDGSIIHSDQIRQGTMDRRGHVFADYLQKGLILNEKQRQFIQDLKFELVDQPANNESYVVGDSSLSKFLKNNWPYQLAIYDLKEKRQDTLDNNLLQLDPNSTTINPAGQISRELVSCLIRALEQKYQLIYVDGEEDLAAVALTLLMPLNTNIYFGQPHQGLAKINVNEDLKIQLLTNLYLPPKN